MRVAVTLLASSFMPLAIFAQGVCLPGSPIGFSVAAQAGFIPSKQPFTLNARLCNSTASQPQDAVIKFDVSDTRLNRLIATYTAFSGDDGTASVTAGGLPSGSYEVVASTGPSSFRGGASTDASFNVGGGAASTALQGQFALLLQGYAGQSTNGTRPRAALIGAFTTDGDGNIVSGEADLNTGFGSFQKAPLTGNYTLDTNGMGTVQLKTSFATLALAVTAAIPQTGTVQTAVFTALTPNEVYGSGTLTRQDPAGFAEGTYLNGNYLANFEGETALNANSPAAPGNSSGQFQFGQLATGSHYANLTLNQNVGAVVRTGQQESLTQGSSDGMGRSTSIFTPKTGYSTIPGFPTQLVSYQIDATHFYIISSDPHDKATLLSGTGAQ